MRFDLGLDAAVAQAVLALGNACDIAFTDAIANRTGVAEGAVTVSDIRGAAGPSDTTTLSVHFSVLLADLSKEDVETHAKDVAGELSTVAKPWFVTILRTASEMKGSDLVVNDDNLKSVEVVLVAIKELKELKPLFLDFLDPVSAAAGSTAGALLLSIAYLGWKCCSAPAKAGRVTETAHKVEEGKWRTASEWEGPRPRRSSRTSMASHRLWPCTEYERKAKANRMTENAKRKVGETPRSDAASVQDSIWPDDVEIAGPGNPNYREPVIRTLPDTLPA